MSADYRSYMASEDWAIRRVRAIERSVRNGTPRCEMCGKAGLPFKNRIEDRRYRYPDSSGLNVHHLNYRSLGQEEPADLIVLCTDDLWLDDLDDWEGVGCHERVHADRGYRIEVENYARERDAL